MKPRVITAALSAVLLVALCGCESMPFTPYNGQSRAWPTGSSFSDQVYDVPVFRGWPERSYDVLGAITFSNPNIDWNQGDIKQAAKRAKQAGGDAMIMLPKGAVGSSNMAALRQDLGLSDNKTAGVVIRWK